jgi:hypothetical protein
LTPLDFFFQGFIKDIVYRKKMQNANESRDRIVTTAQCVTNEMLASTWRENKYCPDACRATNYAHIEIC